MSASVDLKSRIAQSPALIDALGEIAIAAGAVVMRYRGHCETLHKGDGSPVTIADQEAEALILARVRALLPDIPVISEEAASAGDIPEVSANFLLVDALDGTKEFIAGSDEFTVNIALIHKGMPVGGALYAPALQRLWLAGSRAEVCDVACDETLSQARNRHPIRVRKVPDGHISAVASLRHNSPETEALLARFPVKEKRSAGSSLKFCLLAEGKADFYPRLSPTMEWDTAAGHAVLRAAGGKVVAEDGKPLAYNKRGGGFLNPGFIAVGDRALLDLL